MEFIRDLPKTSKKILIDNVLNPIRKNPYLNVRFSNHSWKKDCMHFFVHPNKSAGKSVFIDKKVLESPFLLSLTTKNLVEKIDFKIKSYKVMDNPIYYLCKYCIVEPAEFITIEVLTKQLSRI